MKISAKGDYACKAVLELSLNYHEGKPLQISEIAERQNIPIKFLEQILIILKQGGITKSKRGAEGGYYLVKPPEEITVADVIALTDGPFVQAPCIPQEENCKNSGDCIFRPIWGEVQDNIDQLLREKDFKTLSEQVINKEQLMYYI